MQLTPIADLEAAVSNGALRLDLYVPGWRDRVDATQIEAGCPAHSVTGQLFGDSLRDQINAVGMNLNFERPWESIKEFTSFGYGVMTSDVVEIPAAVISAMKEAALMMAAELGYGQPDLSKIPTVIPVPRDQDLCLHEITALTVLWEREVAKRG